MNIKMYCRAIISLVLAIAALSPLQSAMAQSILISDAYIKATIPGNQMTAAYMTIDNNGEQPVALQSISSSISDHIEIHTHSMVNGMMKMSQVEEIIIGAKQQKVLQPHGLHLMFFAVKNSLNEGESIPITLHFSNNKAIEVNLPVYKFKQ